MTGEEHVELVVQMVRVLAQTVRDVGSSPAQSYILFTKFALVVSKKILFIISIKQLRIYLA